MAEHNDSYCNAVIGRLVEVASRPYGGETSLRMVVIETEEPFVRTVVRRFVRNHQDAELLVDRVVCVYNSFIIHVPQDVTQ